MITAQGVVTVNEATFDRTVLQAQLPVLVDFWAEWCPPCRWLSPIVEDLGVERGRIVGARPKGRLLTELARFLPAS